MAEGGQRLEPADQAQRLAALTRHGETLLVEAGAGSGKTSIMAGRVTLMIVSGIDPAMIVAITFTEAAASELRLRIEEFLREIADGRCPRDLAAVFPAGVPADAALGAKAGLARFDRLTATTIHGFAQGLLKPYPLEAGVDPGATIADPEIAAMAFDEAVDGWMRDRLNEDAPSFLASLFEAAPTSAARTVREVAYAMRRTHGLLAPAVAWSDAPYERVCAAMEAFVAQFPETGNIPEELRTRTIGFKKMLAATAAVPEDGVCWCLAWSPAEEVVTKSAGTFYAKACAKNRWDPVATAAGWGKVEKAARIAAMESAWDEVRNAWSAMKEHAAAVAARRLTEEVSEALALYRNWKRASALLDFDDLLVKARDLLRSNDPIRRKLGQKYARILVDEFQDTDPLQTEIVWRLCGDPVDATLEAYANWKAYRLRPGSLFLVGDPKQAIYRFRGADVQAYLEAKGLIAAGAGEILTISVNFRSTEKILARVNTIYGPVLDAAAGQPGFTALTAFRTDDGPDVCGLPVEIPDSILDARGNPNADGVRLCEARAVALFLQHVIGSMDIPAKGGGTRKAEPGDIALLAPAGTAFWIYEAELDRASIPVAAQAGKGFLNRQEVLDLTQLSRALSDPRDSLALGAFLRGPVLGFTDEEILDAMAAIPGEGRKRLKITMDLAALPAGRFRDAMERLQVLRRMAGRTTPFQVLSAAVEIFRIRAVLGIRHPRSVERSLANLDAFRALSRAWDTRGLKAFADEMRRRRDEGTRQAEGRPDRRSDAVSVVTMHSSKGLEWPIVVPINMATTIVERSGPVLGPDGLLFSLLGHEVPGYDLANQREGAERARERARLLYVADTRARDLLVIPIHSKEGSRPSWCKVCKPRTDQLPSFDLTRLDPEMPARAAAPGCPQDEPAFLADAGRVVGAHKAIRLITPSLHEAGDEPITVSEIGVSAEEMETAPDVRIKGGPKRGLVLHKLMEEILTGELEDDGIAGRASVLAAELDVPDAIDPVEAEQTILRTLALPEIEVLRPRLRPEAAIASLRDVEGAAELTIGIADALAIEMGEVDVVVDWKSDVDPSEATLQGYCSQIRDYLGAVGAPRGLIVLMTHGRVIEVLAPA